MAHASRSLHRTRPSFYIRSHTCSGTISMDLKEHIRGIPDFPKPGILFYDISTLLRDADAWQVAMGRMARGVRAYQPDLLAGIESRGFLIAAPLALKLGCGFIMLRKRNKLPGVTVGLNYSLEYGTDRIEIQADAIEPGQRVVVVDDLLATGGTMAAGIALLRRVGAVVPAAAALIELTFLNGRSRLDVPCEALVAYDE
jgi:adenine phosphoribosyltransferase